MAKREVGDPRAKPISIYECHVGSWRRVPEDGNRQLTWRELADRWSPTWPRWASPTSSSCRSASTRSRAPGAISRSASSRRPAARAAPDDFAYFVDRCHQAGIGLMLDWVPGHFPTDQHGLGRFDGTALYEHEDPRLGYQHGLEHADLQFRPPGGRELPAGRTRSTGSSATMSTACGSMPWPRCSISTIRASPAQWIPNSSGGRENLEAIHFLRRLNELAYGEQPGTMTVAEESTAWPGRVAAGLSRRPGLRLQMEHGLDARHPALHADRAGLPQVPP